MPSIIDTHSHIHGEEFDADRAEVLARARDAAVGLITMIGVDPPDTRLALEIARANPGAPELRVVAGVHPNHAHLWNDEAAAALRDEFLRDPLVVAVGEMGLDYHYEVPRDQQRAAFLAQMTIAHEAGNRPLVIHCREAYDDLLEILEGNCASGDATVLHPAGVLHCYFGTWDQAERAMRLGFLLGIGGASTFKKTDELHEVIRRAPLDALVLETDAPYMTPLPHRGTRNEPSYLTHVAARIAELKGLGVEEVTATTEANARRLYRLAPPD